MFITQGYKNFLIKTTEKITKLIHSHNKMAVFFSSTDMDELNDNSEEHIIYLSLIVNNKNEMCAKMSRIIKINSVIECKDDNGDIFQGNNSYECLEIFDCDISLEYEDLKEKSFIDKVGSIRKVFDSRKIKPFPAVKSIKSEGKIVGSTYTHRFQPSDDFVYGTITEDDIEDFSLYLLSFGEDIPTHWDAEDLFQKHMESGKSADKLSEEMIHKVRDLYDEFFSHVKEKDEEEAFSTVLESVIEEYSIYLHNPTVELFKEQNDYIGLVIENLKEFLKVQNNL